jgi:hypothetical protein
MSQADGYYPRVNASMISSGRFNNQIVSLMGRFVSGAQQDGTMSFSCSDAGTITLTGEHADFPDMDVANGPVVEVVGQVMPESTVAVSTAQDIARRNRLLQTPFAYVVCNDQPFSQYDTIHSLLTPYLFHTCTHRCL